MNERIETALVIGATADIGRAIARKLAEDGRRVAARGPRPGAAGERGARPPGARGGRALVAMALSIDDATSGRARGPLCAVVCPADGLGDLRARAGAAVTAHRCDVLDEDGGVSLLDALDPLPDAAVCVVGLLGDQAESQRDGAAAERVMRTNYAGPALLMGALAERFERRGGGVLVGVSSVAGDRGRAANYVYGSAKAGFTAFLSGLRGWLAASGVHVATVKPGFVRTRMTDGMDLPARLTAEPEEVAARATHRRVPTGPFPSPAPRPQSPFTPPMVPPRHGSRSTLTPAAPRCMSRHIGDPLRSAAPEPPEGVPRAMGKCVAFWWCLYIGCISLGFSVTISSSWASHIAVTPVLPPEWKIACLPASTQNGRAQTCAP